MIAFGLCAQGSTPPWHSVRVSKYWDPSWEKETVVIGATPDLHALEEMIRAGRELEYPDLSGVGMTTCERWDGLIRMAVVGPDYTVLVPAAYRLRAADLQKQIGRLTFYFICTRPRIRAIVEECGLHERRLGMVFEALRDDGSTERFDHEAEAPEWLRAIRLADNGRVLVLTTADGEEVQQDTALLAQGFFKPTPFEPSLFDLKVHYIGRARGDIEKTCALDRLESHEKYQAVMEEVLGNPYRNRDVWLVLGSGTTVHMMTGHSNPKYDRARAEKGDARARLLLTENNRVDLTEAVLINYFKPHLNTHHVGELDLEAKTFAKWRSANVTGVTLAFTSQPFDVAMYTDHVAPRLHHTMTICL
jgi:hypothetical protein